MVDRHRHARRQLKAAQQTRRDQEVTARQARYNKGLLGLWDRLTGTHIRIKTQNEHETLQAHERDQREKDTLIFTQLGERRELQHALRHAAGMHHKQTSNLAADLESLRQVRTGKLREAWPSPSDRTPNVRRGPHRSL